MKKLFNIITVIIFVLTSTNLKADMLIISLKEAYTNNPRLNAERASVRATYQDKNLAISEFMPNITVSGYASEQDNTSDHGADSNFYPTEQSLLVEQKIFDGFTNYKTLMNNPIYDNIKGDDRYYELINKIKDHIDRERIEAGLES